MTVRTAVIPASIIVTYHTVTFCTFVKDFIIAVATVRLSVIIRVSLAPVSIVFMRQTATFCTLAVIIDTMFAQIDIVIAAVMVVEKAVSA